MAWTAKWLRALALAGLAAVPAAAGEAPAVVASIKPVHSLVAGVMAGVGAPELLLRGGASPHAYALRPSDARRLARARVVFWLDETLESFLARPLAGLAAAAEVVALGEAPGVDLLRAREGGIWAEHAHAHAELDRAHGHGGHDPHLWLDPRNARAMVRAIAQALARADPANAARYQANAAALERRLAALDAELEAALAPVADRPYIVFHDAYQYLERRYGLHPAGSITLGPEVAPGAARIAEIRRRIRAGDVACVFAEPEFEPRLVGTVIAGSAARSAVLDPLGAGLEPGPELYFQLMRGLAQALAGCLG